MQNSFSFRAKLDFKFFFFFYRYDSFIDLRCFSAVHDFHTFFFFSNTVLHLHLNTEEHYGNLELACIMSLLKMVGTHTLLKSNGYVLPAMKIEEEMNFLNKCIKCKETRSQLLTDNGVKSSYTIHVHKLL